MVVVVVVGRLGSVAEKNRLNEHYFRIYQTPGRADKGGGVNGCCTVYIYIYVGESLRNFIRNSRTYPRERYFIKRVCTTGFRMALVRLCVYV